MPSADAAGRAIIGGMLREAADGKIPLSLRAAAPVAATLFDQPERRILHLVSLNGDTQYRTDQILPIGRVAVRLSVPPAARSPGSADYGTKPTCRFMRPENGSRLRWTTFPSTRPWRRNWISQRGPAEPRHRTAHAPREVRLPSASRGA